MKKIPVPIDFNPETDVLNEGEYYMGGDSILIPETEEDKKELELYFKKDNKEPDSTAENIEVKPEDYLV